MEEGEREAKGKEVYDESYVKEEEEEGWEEEEEEGEAVTMTTQGDCDSTSVVTEEDGKLLHYTRNNKTMTRRPPTLTVPDSLQLWLRQNYEARPTGNVPKDAVYAHYREFCARAGSSLRKQNIFGKILKSVFPSIRSRRLGSVGQVASNYSGIGRVGVPDDVDDTSSSNNNAGNDTNGNEEAEEIDTTRADEIKAKKQKEKRKNSRKEKRKGKRKEREGKQQSPSSRKRRIVKEEEKKKEKGKEKKKKQKGVKKKQKMMTMTEAAIEANQLTTSIRSKEIEEDEEGEEEVRSSVYLPYYPPCLSRQASSSSSSPDSSYCSSSRGFIEDYVVPLPLIRNSGLIPAPTGRSHPCLNLLTEFEELLSRKRAHARAALQQQQHFSSSSSSSGRERRCLLPPICGVGLGQGDAFVPRAELDQLIEVFRRRVDPFVCLPDSVMDEANLNYCLTTEEGSEECSLLTFCVNFVLYSASANTGHFDIALGYWHRCRRILAEIHDELHIIVALLAIHLAHGAQYAGVEVSVAVSLLNVSVSICEALNARSTEIYVRGQSYLATLTGGEMIERVYRRPPTTYQVIGQRSELVPDRASGVALIGDILNLIGNIEVARARFTANESGDYVKDLWTLERHLMAAYESVGQNEALAQELRVVPRFWILAMLADLRVTREHYGINESNTSTSFRMCEDENGDDGKMRRGYETNHANEQVKEEVWDQEMNRGRGGENHETGETGSVNICTCNPEEICELALIGLAQKIELTGNWVSTESWWERLAGTLRRLGKRHALERMLQLIEQGRPKGLTENNNICDSFIRRWQQILSSGQ